MAKLTREDKIEIYHKRKDGITLSSLEKEYQVNKRNLAYLIDLIDYHGEDVLRSDKNNYYSKELKCQIINKVLIDGQGVRSKSIEFGLTSNGLLSNWNRSYTESNYVTVKKQKGRKSNTMTKTKDKEINRG